MRDSILRPEVARFAEEMEKQLQANEHKGGWKDSDKDFLWEELGKNHSILDFALANRDMPEILRRAANIANFSMMIADNWGGLIKKEQYLDDLYELATVVLPHWIERATAAERDRDVYRDMVKGLQGNRLDRAGKALKAWEKWEADLINCDDAWRDNLPVFTQEIYAGLSYDDAAQVGLLIAFALNDLERAEAQAERLEKLRGKVYKMAEKRIEALQQQLVCYRTGKRLTNKLCDELEYTEEGWKEIKQRWDEG